MCVSFMPSQFVSMRVLMRSSQDMGPQTNRDKLHINSMEAFNFSSNFTSLKIALGA
jgi:hypothetical protein